MSWKNKYIQLMYPNNMEQMKKEEALQFKFKHIPSSLYRYRTFDKEFYNIENLKNDAVRCSPAADFNDPYDCALMIGDYSDREIRFGMLEIIKKIPIKQDMKTIEKMELPELKDYFMEKICYLMGAEDVPKTVLGPIYELTKAEHDEKINIQLQLMNEKSQRETMVSCFSEVKDSILMWSHYANNHTGFCIEYNFKKAGSDSILTQQLQPVIYRKDMFDIGKHFEHTPKNSSRLNSLFGGYASIVKAKEWNYEKEWRLVFSKEDREGFNQELFTPESIYLGTKISEEDKKEILKIAEEKQIKVFQMKRANDQFKLIAEPILEGDK